MKVFVLMYHGAYKGETSSSALLFYNLADAQARMRNEYDQSVKDIVRNFGEDAVYEYSDMSCCTYEEGYYCHNHDEWSICEQEIL
jgi:hypothetical protein